MSGGAATFRSILDKPLNQLTEDDISQLTREDCRKYLKEKGMRRPSWNKSQAIQQVICLKALLEPGDDSGSTALGKVCVSPRLTLHWGSDGQIPVAVAESTRQTPEPQKCSSADTTTDLVNKTGSPRIQCVTKKLVEQMTIFYGGKVNVYDGVPAEKAHTIINIAASPIDLTRDDQLDGSVWPFPCHFQSSYERDASTSPSEFISETIQTEGQADRKVSLQRYLEKRKDRERLKTKRNLGVTSSLKMYFDNNGRIEMANGSSNCFPSQSELPSQAFRSTRPKVVCLPVDLNIKDLQDF